MLIGYRGYATLPERARAVNGAGSPGPAAAAVDDAVLVRADIDSVAVLTEPTLRAWSIPFRRLEAGSGLAAIHEMWDRSQREARPTAVLLTGALSGAHA